MLCAPVFPPAKVWHCHVPKNMPWLRAVRCSFPEPQPCSTLLLHTHTRRLPIVPARLSSACFFPCSIPVLCILIPPLRAALLSVTRCTRRLPSQAPRLTSLGRASPVWSVSRNSTTQNGSPEPLIAPWPRKKRSRHSFHPLPRPLYSYIHWPCPQGCCKDYHVSLPCDDRYSLPSRH